MLVEHWMPAPQLHWGRMYTYTVQHSLCDEVTMRNITVTVDEETHRKARVWAAELDTSVSALVREFLQGLAATASQLDEVNRGGNADRQSLQKLYDHTLAKARVTVGIPSRDLDEVLADFDARGVGLSGWLTRKELYTEALEMRDAPG